MLFTRSLTYPSIKEWREKDWSNQWLSSLNNGFAEDSRFALYLHLPFCKELCSFCGCNTTITNDDELVEQYVLRLIKEFNSYNEELGLSDSEKSLVSLVIGGGTPNYLSSERIDLLLSTMLKSLTFSDNFVGSVEIDPRILHESQIETFRRNQISLFQLGVQDMNQSVQEANRRVLSPKRLVELTQEIQQNAANYGFDLLFGLPGQTEETMKNGLGPMIAANPCRIQVYEWMPPHWNKQQISNIDIVHRKALFRTIESQLLDNGYQQLGYLLFVKEGDPLLKAHNEKRLARRFSGYYPDRFSSLIGLGVSSISESPEMFYQNHKALPVYMREVQRSGTAGFRGCALSADQQNVRHSIYELASSFAISADSELFSKKDVEELIQEGMLMRIPGGLKLSKKGIGHIDKVALMMKR